jgi:hypothetical protein
LRRANDSQYNGALALVNLAMLAIKRERLDDAEGLLYESLAAGRDLGSEEIALYCLEGLASVSATRSRVDVAAQLLGRAAEIRDRLGIQLQQVEQALHDRTVSITAGALGSEEFARLLDLGRTMTSDQAVALAGLD